MKACPTLTMLVLVAGLASASAQEQTAGQAYKNIKVLKDMPASQLMPVMHLMRASLGTRCDFCHVAEGNRYELDTKPEKETAREMIRMVLAINKDNFKGQARVTCNTCHRGQEHPVHVPAIGQAQFDDTTNGSDHHGAQPALPSAAEVLDRYIQALGGRAALENVKSRVSRGTLLRMKVVDSGTPKAWAVNRGQADPFELVQQAPDRATMTVGSPPEQTVQRLDGASGTVKGPGGERPLSPQAAALMAERTDLRNPLKLRDRADKARVLRREPIDGRETVVLRLRDDDGTSRTFYFDTATGLLRRQIFNRPTVLGPDPEQTDFEDYRDVGGVKVPFLVKTSYLDDNHLGTTRKLAEVRDNEAVP
ncbi:MAG TPA: c-type cytochrome [Thermoanaerobaculia bacterium]|nr:c-type cytochrome [Thermoanaerobaculia bacterium]